MTLLESYIEALANNDKLTVAEIEAGLLSIEDEKKSLENKVAALSQEMSSERERILRISADFDNFRKRTERERLSLVTNVQGEVVENLLPVLDNFERAKAQIKVETEGEEKINNSYQSIYKQFVEILTSLGVVTVETVGNPFDPLVSLSTTPAMFRYVWSRMLESKSFPLIINTGIIYLFINFCQSTFRNHENLMFLLWMGKNAEVEFMAGCRTK